MARTVETPLNRLIARCQPGWTLPQAFYSDPEIHQADLNAIWRTGWVFAGHSCEVRRPGDFFTLDIGPDPVVVVRAEDGTVHAHHNVCRHRGSILCTEEQGHAARIVCPYHQWAYGLDGRLIACRGMHEPLDKGTLGLHRVHAREIGGLIFISLASAPIPFESMASLFEPLLRPQGFARARVAKVADYRVRANWKLVWENNRECYHCNLNHPQYIRANFDHFNSDDTTPQIEAQMADAASRVESKWAAAGIPTHRQTGMTTFPDAERGIWFSANRTPLIQGWVSESMDGRQVAPLMGDYPDSDVGTLRMRTLPNFWNHSSCDHGVSTRLLPTGPQETSIRVWWLVDEHAVEGRDYDLGRLTPFWQLTSEQDWLICERQQKGVNSSAYLPGPYSRHKEYNVDGFVRWYLKSLHPGTP